MMRSLYSGVSGLKVHQTKMDVIGNNISNVNTVGFKSSSVNFTDVFYQTTQSASGANTATGAAGQNAMQIGLGSNLASITAAITQTGGSQRTDNPFDIMITGDSFFIVNSGGTNYFTKSGAFYIDGAGNLAMQSGGAMVMGWQVDPDDPTKILKDVVSPLKIKSPENLYADPAATEAAYVSGNIDKKDSQFTSDAGYPVQIGFYDNMGNSYALKLSVKQGADDNKYSIKATDVVDSEGNSIFVTATYNDTTKKMEYKNSSITEFTFGGKTYKCDTSTGVNPDDGTVTLTVADADVATIEFNGVTGKFESVGVGTDVGKTLDFSINANPNPFKNIEIDFSSITQFESSGSASLKSYKGTLESNGADGAGRKVGNMSGVSIDQQGKIYGKYTNGESRLLGQIAVTTFANPSGLEAVGGSLFSATQNSGEFDGIGQDPTTGGGKLTTGVLEMSNVDLSAQFTEMITTQRGFQANSRIITTSDTLLEELINLKR